MQPDRERWRCFWAALPAADAVERLAAAVARLRREDEWGLRWIPPANWHLTLEFLGSLDPDQIAGLGAALRARPLTAPLVLRFRALGPFPRGRPRTLAARLDAGDDLLDWVRYLRAAAAQAGLQPEERPYRAHLTVARPRPARRGPYPELEVEGELSFDRIALVRSELRPDGARYRPLAVQAAGASAGG